MEEYYEFIRKGTREQIDGWLKSVDEAYYNGTSALADENYDNMIKIYESRFGKREKIGSEPTHSAVMLPIAMMSLDKIMAEKELQSFMQKNKGPYIVQDKINGNSSLYRSSTMYNRGDGTKGTDLSHMLPYLNLPNSTDYIKGELVINKKNYAPYEKEYKTNLSMINGLLNSRSADPEKLKLFDFIAYDLISDNESKMFETLEKLKEMKFKVPFYTLQDTLTIESLSALFKKRKEEAEYDIDGLVIASNQPISYEQRLIRENPKHMVAFKEYGETAVATVEEVIWEVSKNCLIKPKVRITPVTINNFTISSLTAFNAGWVLENNVGKGTQLIITHNTIPHILSVLQSTKADLPSDPETWKWNETKVDIVLLEENDTVKIAKIYEFFKQIDAKYLGEVTIGKLYHAGFNTVKKILEAKKDDFMKRGIVGLGEGIFDRMIKSINEAMSTITLPQLMSASCVFGIGFGVRKLVLITDTYPNILEMDVKLEDIVAIKGFADKTAERFILNLPKFKTFFEELKEVHTFAFEREKKVEKVGVKTIKLQIKKPGETQKVSQITQNAESIAGKTVVFTGFRDKALEIDIINMGGKVTTGVSKNTSLVVVGGKKGTGSSKEVKAADLGIPIYSLADFKKKFDIKSEFIRDFQDSEFQ